MAFTQRYNLFTKGLLFNVSDLAYLSLEVYVDGMIYQLRFEVNA